MKTTERNVLGIESLEELLEGWDHIRSNRKMLRGPLILPNYFMEVDGESSIAETLARLVDNLSKDSVLMTFQGRVKSFAYYLPYTAPGESDFPGLRTFDAIYKKNLCRFGMPFEGVIAIDITEWILAKATKSEKFLAFLAYIATIDEKSLIIFVSTARQALYNNEAYATIAARTRVRYVSIGESDEERARTLFLQCLEEGGFSLAPEAEATLRSVISFVLSVGDNRGYRAIRELASEMIYDQLSSCSPHDVLLKEDVEKYLAESDWGKRYGRLRAGAKMGLVG